MRQPQQSITSSISKGINFHFQDGENQIRAFASMFSGKEIIYLDGKEVSSKRSINTGSIHKFTIDNVKYEIEFSVTNILLGHISCTLIKEGIHEKTLEFKYTKNKKSAFKLFVFSTLGGAAIGAVAVLIAFSIHKLFFANGL